MACRLDVYPHSAGKPLPLPRGRDLAEAALRELGGEGLGSEFMRKSVSLIERVAKQPAP